MPSGLSDAAAAMRNRMFSLPVHLPGDLGDELLPRPGLGAGVDRVHRGDQQLDQGVGDLPLPAVQVGRH